MKKILALLAAIVLALVLLVVVILDGDSDEETECTPGDGGSSSSGSSIAANAEGLAEPMVDAVDHVTSTYKSPDRPDHRGVDIAKEDKDPIYSIADGTVVKAEPATGFGYWVVISHEIDGETYDSVYGHMFQEGIHVSAGDKVKAGDHIADQGWNGGVDPAGPAGSHLHIEIWEGSRDAGTEVDPMPFLERAAEGGGEVAPPSQEDSEDDESGSRSGSGGEMPDSDKIQFKENLQVDSIRVARAVAERFPEIETIGGWREYDERSDDHPSGRAVDVMIPNWESSDGRKLGDEIKDYVYGNRDFFNVEYMIWRQQYIPAEGTPNQMEDRGDPTQNHYDHVHITVVGGGTPEPGQKYGVAPEGGSASPGDSAGDGEDCIPEGAVHADAALAEGQVPEQFVKWLKLGGRECAGISSPLLAAQMQQESGFQEEIGSPAGAQGPAQFMPGTWATWGFKVDDNGKKTGAAGAGDITSPADATMAQARLMCANFETAERKVADGTWSGDTLELALAAYNAGEGNVDAYSGVPPFAETQHYVKVIPESAEQFEDKV